MIWGCGTKLFEDDVARLCRNPTSLTSESTHTHTQTQASFSRQGSPYGLNPKRRTTSTTYSELETARTLSHKQQTWPKPESNDNQRKPNSKTTSRWSPEIILNIIRRAAERDTLRICFLRSLQDAGFQC